MKTLVALLALPFAFGADAPYISAGFLKIPAEVKLGPMSAVEVDRKGNTYVLHRGEPPLLAFDKDGNKVAQFSGGADHFANFLKAVRSRKSSDLAADILEGHLSSALCHLGNISYRLGEEVAAADVAGKVQSFHSHDNSKDTVERTLEHLKANKVDLATAKIRVGLPLKLDPKTESFVGAPAQATAMLSREYRKGFEVPSSAANV